jgi:hypothetical protein
LASKVGAAVGCGAARSQRCAAREAGNDPYDLDLALAEAAQEAASSIAAFGLLLGHPLLEIGVITLYVSNLWIERD